MSASRPLIDGFGRRVSYVRLSVTDRCDLRCAYCMSAHPTFLPRGDLLSFDELERLCGFFIARGVERLRVTGGEPLMRRGILDFLTRVGEHVHAGRLRELTLTTNGTQLERGAEGRAAAGIRRVNVSCDTLRPDVFRRVTRGGSPRRRIAARASAGAPSGLSSATMGRPIGADDLHPLLRLAATEAQLRCREQPIDDHVIAADTIVDQL